MSFNIDMLKCLGMNIRFRRLHPDAAIPEYKTPGSVAFDLALVEDVIIQPRSMEKVRTGLVIEAPKGHALLLASRSSNPVKKGIDLANSIGIIDEDYCGPEDELFLVLQNLTDDIVRLSKGDRIAQGLFVPVTKGTFIEVPAQDLANENRGGHGSTGR